MRAFVLIACLGWSAVAGADETNERLLGRVNVNTATAAELGRVPGLNAVQVSQIVDVRARGAVRDISALPVSKEARDYLKTDGETNLRRIRQLPLEILSVDSSARPARSLQAAHGAQHRS